MGHLVVLPDASHVRTARLQVRRFASSSNSSLETYSPSDYCGTIYIPLLDVKGPSHKCHRVWDQEELRKYIRRNS